ncbi:MAG: hypothetical protein AAF711_18680 [Planctomycetota bacterium]
MHPVIAQQLGGEIFLPAIYFLLFDAVAIGMIAAALLIRLVDRDRVWTIAVLCFSATAGFAALMSSLGLDLMHNWNKTFYATHAAFMMVAFTLLFESIYRLKNTLRSTRQSMAYDTITLS